MRLFQALFGRRKPREKPRTDVVEQEAPQGIYEAIVCLDVLNITKWKLFRRRKISWQAALQRIEQDLRGFRVSIRRAYEFVPPDPHDHQAQSVAIRKKTEEWRARGYEFVPDRKDDVDPLIMVDLMGLVMQVMEKHKDHEEVTVRIVLGSGDGDYLRALRAIKHAYPKRLKLEVVVYTFSDSINRWLKEFAGRESVRHLDMIPEFLVEPPQKTFASRR